MSQRQRVQVQGQLDRVAANRVFRALADATRRDILARTLIEEQTVSARARGYPRLTAHPLLRSRCLFHTYL